MPTYEEDYLKIQNARNKQGQLNQEAAGLKSRSQTFKSNVMEKVRSNLASMGMDKLSQDYGRASGQIVSEPAAMRARMSDVNPLQVDALTAKQLAQTLDTLTSIGQFQKQRDASVSELIGAGTDRLIAEATQKKAEADAAKDEADSLIEMVKLKMDEEKMRFDMAQKGGETDPRDVLAMIMGGQSTNKPQYTPGSGNGTVSNDGKWVWNNGDWQSIGTGNNMRLTREQAQMAIMADPKNASYYTSLYTFMNPEDKNAGKLESEKQVVTGVIDQLNKLYYGEEGTEDDLAKGRIGGAWTGIKSLVGAAPTAKTYNDLRNGIVASLKSLVGESGVLTNEDTERIKNLLPPTNATAVEAQKSWAELYKFIENKYQTGYSIVEEL